VTLRVQLFGSLQATWQGQPLPILRRPRLQSLWAYLLLVHRHGPAPRDQLAFNLWPDLSEERARTELRQHVYLLRRWLPSGNGDWLAAERDEIHLSACDALWVDAWALQDALTQGEAELEAAVALVAGDLLPHLGDMWLAPERERLRRIYSRALSRLVIFSQARGDWPSAIIWARRLVAHDPFNEEAHRWLIGLYCMNGNRAAALQQFETCQRLLREDLGLAPMPETLALRDAILHGEDVGAGEWNAGGRPGDTSAWPLTLDARPAPASTMTLPFTGRDAELRRLTELWTRASQRSGAVIFVGGEAGVGKTRLLEELAAHTRRRGGLVLWGHCYDFEHASPYQPVVELLRGAQAQLALGRLPPLWLAEVARLLPELREQYPNLPQPAQVQPEHEQARLVEGLCRYVLAVAYQQPLLVLLEDLHWAAASTLVWLRALAHRARFAPILIVGTYRQEEAGLGHPLRDLLHGLRREGWSAPILLQPLADATTHEVIQRLSGLGEDAAGPAQHLYAESEGNPFFLLELIRHLEESGQLRQDDGRWAGPWLERIKAGLTPALALPEGVRDTIKARLEHLGEAARELLGCAAVAGREFDLAILRAALGWQEARVLHALEELLERGLVREQSGPGRRDHAFGHHLVQEVTYAALPRAWREALHRWVGEAMFAAYGEGAAGELAHHFELGGARERALIYLKRAGDEAAARYANDEALDYYRRALDVVVNVEWSAVSRHEPTRWPIAADHWPVLFDLLAARSEVWALLGRREEQRTDLEALESAAGMLRDAARLARKESLWAHLYEGTGDHVACAAAARRALALFKQTGDRRGEAVSLHTLGLAAYREGDYRAARDFYEQALALRQEIADPAGEANTLNLLGNLMRQIGEYATAQAYHERALVLCRAGDDRMGEAESLRSLGALYLFSGDYPRSQAHYEEGLALCRAIGHSRGEAAHLQGLVFLAIVAGDYDAAAAHQYEVMRLHDATGDREAQAWAAISLGMLAWHLGDYEQAESSWGSALDLARQIDMGRVQLWALDNLGNLRHEQGEYDAARHCLQEVHDLARQAGDRRLEAYSLHHLGQLAWDEGDPTTAISCWREAATLRQTLGLTTFARTSQARLAQALAPDAEAREIAESVWRAWQAEPPQGEEEDEVRQGYLALARAFERMGAPDLARGCLAQARAFVASRALHIADDARRTAFLTHVPIHRALEAAGAKLSTLAFAGESEQAREAVNGASNGGN
jgi:predicted ATPase